MTPSIYSNNGVLFYFVNGSNVITGTTDIGSGAWAHVALVRSSGTTRLFLNGAQEGSNYSNSNDYIGNTNRPIIGANGDGANLGTNGVNGWLDEIRVSKGTDRSWSGGFTPPTRAYSNFATLAKPPNNLGLVGYWSFDEGTSTRATDFSGNGNHGTLTDAGDGLPVWVNGKRGKALDMDVGSPSGYVDAGLGSTLNIPGDVSVCVWTKSMVRVNRLVGNQNNGGFRLQYRTT